MKIKNLIMALAFGLAPFFSLSNIFDNGTIQTVSPKTDTAWRCFDGSQYHNDLTKGECSNIVKEKYETTVCTQYYDMACRNLDVVVNVVNEYKTTYIWKGERCTGKNSGTGECYKWEDDRQLQGTEDNPRPWSTCPPDSDPTYTYPLDDDDDGKPDRCADPATINLNDSCNANSTEEILANAVVETGSVCHTKPDGSVCQYNAVDFGGGTSAYVLDYEGDCYNNPQPEPTGQLNPVPETSDSQCLDWGGTGLMCPEDPNEVCSTTDSSVGVGNINSCREGCGEVNGIFSCLDNDTDNDDIPDYLDPDIDGDGIPNDDDLDSDGDGKDDPITNPGTGDGETPGSGGSVSVELDLAPVVNELKKINSSISETDVTLNDKPSDGVTSFWESEYPDGLQGVFDENMAAIEDSSFMVFMDKFNFSVSGGSAVDYNMCFNLGKLGNYGCQSFAIDNRVWGAIRIFILVTAVFLCRKILFGG